MFEAQGKAKLTNGWVEVTDIGATMTSRYIVQRCGLSQERTPLEVNPGIDFFDVNTWVETDNGEFWWWRLPPLDASGDTGVPPPLEQAPAPLP